MVRQLCSILIVLGISESLFGQASPLTITNSPPSGNISTAYSFQFTAKGGSGGPYQWSLNCGSAPDPLALGFICGLPPGLSMSSSGAISGTPTATGNYSFGVFVFDPPTQGFASGNFSITIVPPVITISPSTLPDGEVNVRYSQTFTASGGTAPYSFTAQPVSPFNPNLLPDGLALSPNGPLTGTPQTAGTYGFIITATDAKKFQSQPTQYSLIIQPPPSITTTSPLPGGSLNVPYQPVTFTATGGVTPYTFLVSGAVPGLTLTSGGVLSGTPTQAGAFQLQVAVRDAIGGVSPTTPFQITITTNQPAVQVTPLSLAFKAVAGGDAPPPQELDVVPAPTAQGVISFRVLIDAGQANTPAPPWLTVKPASGNAPARLVVSAEPGTMPAGNSSARIRIIDANGATDVAVSFSISSGSPQLEVVPNTLRFSARAQSPTLLEQVLAVRNSGGGGPLSFSSSIARGSTWIVGVTPGTGQTVRNSFVFVRIRVNTQGLTVGSYRDVIHFSFTGGSVDVAVSLFVADSGPIIGTNVTGLRFQARQGGGSSITQTVRVLNLGDPASTVNWTAELVSGSNVFSASPANGIATTSNPGSLVLTLNQGAAQLAPGGYYALLRISDSKSRNSPQYVVIVLDQQSSATPALPDPSPAGLFFTATAGGAQTAGQVVSVNTSSSIAVSFQAAAITFDGGSWLIVKPSSGNSSGQAPGTVTINIDPSRLTAGIYTGEVSISISGVVRTVNVTLVVLPVGSTTVPESTMAAMTGEVRPAAAGCTASKLALTETGLVNNFAVPAKWPATLIVQLNDDCGSPVAGGSVVASFSNGDAPISLRGDGQNGTYSATWQPGSVSSQMVVTLNATAGTFQPASMQLTGGITQNQAPVLAPGGTVNAFYRVSGGPLSPGTIVEMYGSGLASSTSSAGAPPLPKTFNGTFVLVGGLSAPLFFLSDGQLDVQIPSELGATQQHLIIVSSNGALTLPDQIDLLPLQPAVDAFADGRLIAQHTDATATLVDAAHPAKPDEVLVMYLLGMGPTNPAVASGAPAPSTEPLARVTAQPTVTVDGEIANVQFAGLTPTFSGLYQINFVVPKNARSGDLEVVVAQSGVAANTTKLPVSK
jgi:large repetitive protein